MNAIIKFGAIGQILVVALFAIGVFGIASSAFAFGDSESGGCCGGSSSYSQGNYYSQSSYYSQSGYYSQGNYYSQSSYYDQSSYYSQSSYYDQSSYYSQSGYNNPVASCDLFTGAPTTLPYGGGNVTLTWGTTNATSVSIDNGVGSVDADGSKTVAVTGNTTFHLTAVGTGGNGNCTATVTVSDIQAPSCDSFTGNPTSLPYGGGDVQLTWATTNATNVSIDQGVGSVDADGSKTVKNVTSEKTFTLTASNVKGSVECSVPVTIQPQSYSQGSYYSQGEYNSYSQGSYSSYSQGSYSSYSQGSYGGGSQPPQCDIDASAEVINSGKEISLTWTSKYAVDLVLKDNYGTTLVNTKDLPKSQKSDFYKGEIKVSPVKNTTYSLYTVAGQKDHTCTVSVKVGGGVTVLETRNQQPIVGGISLTQVPYTGFDAGPTLTIIFYALLTFWALFIAYMIVIKRDSFAGFAFTKNHFMPLRDASLDTTEPIAQEYVASVTTAEKETTLPTNLPIAAVASAAIGYEAFAAQADPASELTMLENHAHAQKVLLSSDAMRYFIGQVPMISERTAKLDAVLESARSTFPSEDGWVVVNLARMEQLINVTGSTTAQASAEAVLDTTPTTSGSLAEAIVMGNIVAAYEMISHRPMIALADAASDLDAVYRKRKGEDTTVSDLLIAQTGTLSDEQIKMMISALTSAVDGTYNDEASAVKMAIMKAVKVVA